MARNVRDRSLRETTPDSAETGLDPPDSVMRFVLHGRPFQLVVCHHKDAPKVAEVARFRLGSLSIAVLEARDLTNSAVDAGEIIGRLTERELQIAALVAQGAATKNIAHQLRISEWTVGTHLRRIFAKLNVDNRAAMVYRCAPLLKSAPSHPRALPDLA